MIAAAYWIWFQLLFGFGTRRAELFLSYFDNPYEIYEGIQAKNRVVGMLTPKELSGAQAAMERAVELEHRTRRKGCEIITPEHPLYPPMLGEIYAKPAALYVKGDLSCLQSALCIAMVGTRHRTEYGSQAAIHIAQGLARAGAVVVSGLARGIDTDAHQAALDAGGKTIGILGCGLDIDYPKGNAPLKTAMSRNGAVVSEFPLGMRPSEYTFPIRNRIISGISHGTVVVEADVSSGSLITAHHALEQGRDVFAVPGGIFSARARGTHQLLRDGAKLTESAQDIFDEFTGLGFAVPYRQDNVVQPAPIIRKESKTPKDKPQPQKPENQKKKVKSIDPPADLTPAASCVLNALSHTPISVEKLAEQVEVPMGDLLSALTELEIYGLIQGYPGRAFGLY